MTMYQHQQKAVERFKDKAAGALFFDTGTGKSLTALEIAKYKYQQGLIDCLLIIAPNGVHRQWAVEEIPKWMAEVDTVVTWRKGKPIPYNKDRLNICCTNIDQFSTTSVFKKYVDWVNSHKTMIILDEATRIKNPKALRTQRLLYEFNEVVKRGRTIVTSTPKTVARLILTGTPVTNGPLDVWSMFEFLEPGYFGCNWYAFQNHYGLYHSIEVNGRVVNVLINEEVWNAIKHCETFDAAALNFGVTLSTYTDIKAQTTYQGPFRHVDELREAMSKVAVFVKIQDCIDMPQQSYIRRTIEMSPEQMRVYNEMEKSLLSQYEGQTVSAKTKLSAYIRLQQIASGFIAPDEDPKEPTWFADSPKLDRLLLDLEEIGNEQAVIVCHFTAEASMLFDKLTEKGYKVNLQTGWKRVGTMDSFKRGDQQLMVANVRCISMGFNMQYCHRMFFYSNTFSLEDRLQVEARIFRSGQTQKCIYIDYVMYNTIDMKVYAVLKRKASLANYIRDQSIKDMLTKVDDIMEDEYELV